MKHFPLLLLPLLWTAAEPVRAQQYRAFWVDVFHVGYKNPAEVDRMIEDCVKAGCNALFVEFRHRGGSYFAESLEPPAEDATWSPGFDAMRYTIERAHARGIEVHHWFPVTPLWPFTRPPADPRHVWHQHGPNAEGDAMWMTVSSAGRLSTSLDPGHPGVTEYLADAIVHPLRHYDLDGIHLDYIRYPEDADYGWNPRAVERWRRLENRTGSPRTGEAVWSEFRRRQVTQLVRQVYLRAHEIKPKVKVSAAAITWGDGPRTDAEFRAKDAYSRVFQDWRGWLEEGILDLAMPMNYFDNARFSGFFDRWIEFEKDRQYNRGTLIGPAIYLNSIAESLNQAERALTPSAAGNRALGLCFYSYASTNRLNPAGSPIEPNDDFYRRIAGLLGEAQPRVPELPWLERPAKGHLLGRLIVSDAAANWLADGLEIVVESDTGRPVERRTVTDGAGYFGLVDLDPDRYRVRLERGGSLLWRAVPLDVIAGRVARVDVTLKNEDFEAVLPRVFAANKNAAAPGDLIVLNGARLAREYAPAATVPLPVVLGRTQVLVNGSPAPLSYVEDRRIELQLPFDPVTPEWRIQVRHAGMEGNEFTLRSAAVSPAVIAARRAGDSGRYLEIYATGLGMTEPAGVAGAGGNAQEPYQRVTAEVTVRVNGQPVRVLFAGLAPFQPYRYQVNVELPPGAESGELVLSVGGVAAAPARF